MRRPAFPNLPLLDMMGSNSHYSRWHNQWSGMQLYSSTPGECSGLGSPLRTTTYELVCCHSLTVDKTVGPCSPLLSTVTYMRSVISNLCQESVPVPFPEIQLHWMFQILNWESYVESIGSASELRPKDPLGFSFVCSSEESVTADSWLMGWLPRIVTSSWTDNYNSK